MEDKAKQRALEAYPIESHEMYDDLYRQRNAYFKGYNQAEKDLELGWEDMKLIWNITDEMDNMPEEKFYQEVLKRFKERKEK